MAPEKTVYEYLAEPFQSREQQLCAGVGAYPPIAGGNVEHPVSLFDRDYGLSRVRRIVFFPLRADIQKPAEFGNHGGVLSADIGGARLPVEAIERRRHYSASAPLAQAASSVLTARPLVTK